jgi:hypothetical protein
VAGCQIFTSIITWANFSSRDTDRLQSPLISFAVSAVKNLPHPGKGSIIDLYQEWVNAI